MKRYSSIFGILAVITALNYFAFRVELFEKENEASHPLPSSSLSLTMPTLNWETFDKDNASQAFVITIELTKEYLFTKPVERLFHPPPVEPFYRIRDKSPPSFA